MSKPVVLIVDDEEIVHLQAQRHATQFALVSAYNGAQARECLATRHIDIVVLDLHFPGGPGFVLLDEIRARLGDLPVIVFSSDGSPRNRMEALRRDAAFLVKTVENMRRLDTHLRGALTRRSKR